MSPTRHAPGAIAAARAVNALFFLEDHLTALAALYPYHPGRP